MSLEDTDAGRCDFCQPSDQAGDVVFQIIDLLYNWNSLFLITVNEHQSHPDQFHFQLVIFQGLHLERLHTISSGFLTQHVIIITRVDHLEGELAM